MYHDYRVIGIDREGNVYRLNVKRLISNDYANAMDIEVELPFSPDHNIWPELRKEQENDKSNS